MLLLVPGHLATSPHLSADGPQLLVKFKPGVDDRMVRHVVAATGSSELRMLPGAVHVVRVREDADLAATLATYRASGVVAYAESDSVVLPASMPNDPNYSREWHLDTIHAPAAWDVATASGVMIAICDTGVQANQPDLAPVLRADLGYNSVDGSANFGPITNHGTLVAGAAAAAVNNSIGLAGVAAGATILPIRITNRSDGGASVSDAAACITYAADKGARVINLSFEMANSSAIDDAARYARSKGALTFVGAGNEGVSESWPDYTSLIAVGATEVGDTHAKYSNYGPFVDISAPGTGIMTTWPDGHYDAASGTSFASPVAAGVAALIFGANPRLTASQAQDILFNSADHLGSAGRDPYFGYGRVNALKAVQAARGGASSASPASTSATSGGSNVSTAPQPMRSVISAPADQSVVSGAIVIQSQNAGPAPASVALYVDGELLTTVTSSPAVVWDTTVFSNGAHEITLQPYSADGTAGLSDSRVVVVNNTTKSTSFRTYAAAVSY